MNYNALCFSRKKIDLSPFLSPILLSECEHYMVIDYIDDILDHEKPL